MTSTAPTTTPSQTKRTTSPSIPSPHHLTTSKTLPIHPRSPSPSATHSKTTQSSTIHPHSSKIEVSIPDGRRNSLGEPLHSPLETWTPNLLKRNQSWNHQDLKRLHVEEVLKKEEWRNDEGMGGYSFEEDGEGEGGK
ncbi:hypothetical protein EYC80_008104 [Monilinia laxa]|uniref:Uncharacterized protein n=1 Tax=Monilinia laxa TaxID=61186 RepID=A0A5N6JUT1_MONLA|nr:hypothetical protein EYC80_008104 [Monilinia laxa]